MYEVLKHAIHRKLFTLSFSDSFTMSIFQRDGTAQLFGTTGQKFLPCPGTKGQRDKLKILPRDGILTACPVPSRDVPRDRNERKNIDKMEFFL